MALHHAAYGRFALQWIEFIKIYNNNNNNIYLYQKEKIKVIDKI